MEAILQKEIVVNKPLCRIIAVFTFVVFTSLGAFVRIPLPFTPVPLTLQTFFVLLSGAFLGSGLGALTQLSYVLLGVYGLPIFTGAGSGLIYLLGPTGGYLFGFVLASLFAGRMLRYAKGSLLCVFAIFSIADFLLLACGTIWLKILLSQPFSRALSLGFIPFIPGDLLKAGAASFIYLKMSSRLKGVL